MFRDTVLPVNREILRLAVPFIISNITVPLVGSVDTALMGHLGSSAHLGAVGLASAIFNFLFWNFAFLRMALAGLTAQSFGQADPAESGRLLARSLSLALTGALLVILLQGPIAEIAFAIAGADPQVEQLARDYFRIRIWAAPATISLFALTGWFIGMQDARTPMIISILVNLANLAGNFFFVVGMGMKAEGVALGTVIAQYTGLGYAVVVMLIRHRKVFSAIRPKGIFQGARLRVFFSVNSDVFLRTLAIIIVLTFYNFASAKQGTVVLGTNVIFLQLVFAFSFFVDGFANAGEALVGRFIGEGNRESFSTSVRYLLVWGAGLGLLFSLGYGLFFEQVCRIYTADESIIQASAAFAPWIAAIPVAGAAAFILDGVYLGATATKEQRNITIFSSALFFAAYLPLKDIYGNHALLMAQLLFFGMRSLLLTLWYRRAVLHRYFPGMPKEGPP